MAHHLGVGFVVRLDIEPVTVRSVHRSVHPKKNVVLVENQRLVSTMSKLNQSNATVLQSKPEINPVPIRLAQDSLRTYRTLDFPIAVFRKLLIAFARKFLVNKLFAVMKLS